MTANPDNLGAALKPHGLRLSGGFAPGPQDDVPPLDDARPARTLYLVGHAGPAMWAAFSRSAPADDHPLDRWSRQVLDDVAGRFGGLALLPGDGPPWLPFQRWAQAGDAVYPSPIGLLIHPEYGLWHGYRGALAFAESLPLPIRDPRPSPCESCAQRPCLSTCPAGAFGPEGYDVPACTGHLALPAGADCLQTGCRARRACPVGRDYHYPADQAALHMAAFFRAHSNAD
jgi:hypothetical protein